MMDAQDDIELALEDCSCMLDSIFPIEGDVDPDTSSMDKEVEEEAHQEEISVDVPEPTIKDYADEF